MAANVGDEGCLTRGRKTFFSEEFEGLLLKHRGTKCGTSSNKCNSALTTYAKYKSAFKI